MLTSPTARSELRGLLTGPFNFKAWTCTHASSNVMEPSYSPFCRLKLSMKFVSMLAMVSKDDGERTHARKSE